MTAKKKKTAAKAAKAAKKKKTAAKKAPASKSGKKKTTAKKASARKSSAKKSSAKKSSAKKSSAKKSSAKKSSVKSAGKKASASKPDANKSAATQARPEKTPAPPKPEAAAPRKPGAFSSLDVNMGHVFGLRPRIATSFRPDAFREARHLLQDQSFADAGEAARAVAEKALELTQEGGVPGRGRHARRF